MDHQLHRRLQRLGMVKGTRNLPVPSPAVPPAAPQTASSSASPRNLSRELPGGECNTPYGPVWVVAEEYGPDHCHGAYALGEMAQLSAEVLNLVGVPDLGPCPAFLDTETTGLAGGTGTLVFLTGVALWREGGLAFRQLFLNDPATEGAALRYLDALLAEATGLVTFNGRGFDVPLLQSRFILNRLAPRFTALPHLDLLPVARSLWRDHLPSRRLGYLETALLGIEREGTDIPSALIPEVYRDYLTTGRTDELAGVFYHNLVDVLSMVTLLTHVARLCSAPERCNLAPAEWAGIGRLYEQAGRTAEAENAWVEALAGDLPAETAARLWRTLGQRYRRQGAWTEALGVWAAWAERIPWAIEPLVEQAKFHEWVGHDRAAALAATETALQRALRYPRYVPGFERVALERRRARLLGKAKAGDGAS